MADQWKLMGVLPSGLRFMAAASMDKSLALIVKFIQRIGFSFGRARPAIRCRGKALNRRPSENLNPQLPARDWRT